ncbi:unnamed protein product [Prorocentrum cordatum]|uniref:Uncharacterized protein n=1 Tax=Prorocentrum cordatum TaxID=2364126 RepID=A0ABN9UW61_9DINO|nr:unnamed protein product [Polarella glacialis]
MHAVSVNPGAPKNGLEMPTEAVHRSKWSARRRDEPEDAYDRFLGRGFGSAPPRRTSRDSSNRRRATPAESASALATSAPRTSSLRPTPGGYTGGYHSGRKQLPHRRS